jgi:hypothetical protein
LPAARSELWPRSTNPKWQSAVDICAGANHDESVEAAIVGKVIGVYDADF